MHVAAGAARICNHAWGWARMGLGAFDSMLTGWRSTYMATTPVTKAAGGRTGVWEQGSHQCGSRASCMQRHAIERPTARVTGGRAPFRLTRSHRCAGLQSGAGVGGGHRAEDADARCKDVNTRAPVRVRTPQRPARASCSDPSPARSRTAASCWLPWCPHRCHAVNSTPPALSASSTPVGVRPAAAVDIDGRHGDGVWRAARRNAAGITGAVACGGDEATQRGVGHSILRPACSRPQAARSAFWRHCSPYKDVATLALQGLQPPKAPT